MVEADREYDATLRIRRDDARFGPPRHTLLPYDGARFRTQAIFQIEQDPYIGEWAMTAPRKWRVAWIASGDLADTTPAKPVTGAHQFIR